MLTRSRIDRPEAADPPSPRGCTALKVRQLSRRVSQHFDRIVAAAGLKTTQYSLLSVLAASGPMRPGDLADALQMDASTLTRNLQPLVAQGWVCAGPGADGRSRIVSVSAAGLAKRRQAQREWKRAQAALNSKLGESNVALLHDLIDQCMEMLNEPAPAA